MTKIDIMKLELTAYLGEGEHITPEHKATAARLLRDAAERIERGDDLGGFYFGPDDSHDGGFAVYPEKRDTR